MNIHIILEGDSAAKEIYKHWIPLVNENLSYVDHISKIIDNNFSIVAGGGYPEYKPTILAGIADVNNYNNIDRLVIAVDSEEMSFKEKYDEITEHLSETPCNSEIKIIIQHFCFEAWALGNTYIISHRTQDRQLIEYKRFYNVKINDPELLPAYSKDELNRAQFAYKYLRKALSNKYRTYSYSKRDAGPVLHEKYFKRINERLEKTKHMQSFNYFLEAFK